MNIKSKIKNSLLGFIVGDVIGVPYEFSEESLDRCFEINKGGFHNQDYGTWSDDTSLLLCSMDAINKKGKLFKEQFKKNLIDFYTKGSFTATGEVFDIGNTVVKSLINNFKVSECIYNNGNGSLLYTLPIAIYFKDSVWKKEVIDCVKLIHNHELSFLSSIVYCNLYLSYLNGKNISVLESFNQVKDDFSNEVNKQFEDYFINPININLGYVLGSLYILDHILLNDMNYKESIEYCLRIGGDTDSNAAIVGAIISLKDSCIQEKDILDRVKRIDYIQSILNNFCNFINKTNG
jgi:ADP-ribosylglycohydrolase